MKKNRNRNRLLNKFTPQDKKINTMISCITRSIDENFITLEELKYVVKQVELKFKERKINGKS